MSSTRSSIVKSGPPPFFVSEMRDTDDELVEDARRTLDDVEVAGCDGVEGARNDAALHDDPAPLS